MDDILFGKNVGLYCTSVVWVREKNERANNNRRWGSPCAVSTEKKAFLSSVRRDPERRFMPHRG